jgi:hypothetical protein
MLVDASNMAGIVRSPGRGCQQPAEREPGDQATDVAAFTDVWYRKGDQQVKAQPRQHA